MACCEMCGREPFSQTLKYKCVWRDRYHYFCSMHCFDAWDQNKDQRKKPRDTPTASMQSDNYDGRWATIMMAGEGVAE